MKSIYDVDGAQDVPKSSDVLNEENELVDPGVGYMNRPTPFSPNDRTKADPYFKEYLDDSDLQDKYLDEFHGELDPHEFSESTGIFVESKQYLKSAYRNVTHPHEMVFFLKKAQSEFTISELMDLMDSIRDRTHSLSPYEIKGDLRDLVWQYKFPNKTGHPGTLPNGKKYTPPPYYIVTVKLEKDNKTYDLMELKVKVSCSCPFWRFQGPDYNAVDKGYIIGPPQADVFKRPENPDHYTNLICKHVFRAGLEIQKIVSKYGLDIDKDIKSILTLLINSESNLHIPLLNKISEFFNKSGYLERSELNELKNSIDRYTKDKKLMIFNDIKEFLKDKFGAFSHEELTKLKNDLKTAVPEEPSVKEVPKKDIDLLKSIKSPEDLNPSTMSKILNKLKDLGISIKKKYDKEYLYNFIKDFIKDERS